MRAIALTILITGCGAMEPQVSGPDELLDIAANFYAEWDARTGEMHSVSDMDIGWMTAEDRAENEEMIGYWLGGTFTIRIDRDFWDHASDLRKEALMFHEMAHFIMHRDHDEATFACSFPTPRDAGCPYSLMYPYAIPSKVLKAYREMYMVELFGG